MSKSERLSAGRRKKTMCKQPGQQQNIVVMQNQLALSKDEKENEKRRSRNYRRKR